MIRMFIGNWPKMEKSTLSLVWERVAYNGKRIRLTDVQKRHIDFFHPEALKKDEMLMETIETPDIVTIGGRSDTRILYRFYETTAVSSKYLAVVVKELNQEGFILTSYLTDRIRRRRVVWRRVS